MEGDASERQPERDKVLVQEGGGDASRSPQLVASTEGEDGRDVGEHDRVPLRRKNSALLKLEARLASSSAKQQLTTSRRPSRTSSKLTSTRAKSSLLDKASLSWRSKPPQEEVIPPGLPGCRLGVFAVMPLKAESPPTSSRFRLPRISISVRLLPYEEILTTRSVTGPDYAWSSPLRFTHIDPTRTGLILQLSMYDEPLLGNRILIGRSYMMLEDALDAPGIPIQRWRRVEPTNDGAITSVLSSCTNTEGRIFVSLCFHPRVSKGPTVHALLHSVAHGDVDPSSSDMDHTVSTRRKQSQVRAWMDKLRGRSEVRAVEAATMGVAQSVRRAKGSLSFKLQGLHFCGDQCTKLDGHSTVSLPDFHPIVLVRFDNYEEEIRATAATSDALTFIHEWPVYSSFAKVEVEVYRPVTVRPVSVARRRMSDGSLAIKVGSLSLSCFEMLEQQAVSWTRDLLEPILGPGKRPPLPGYQWYPLMTGDEEVGLASISAHYSEDLFSLVDSEENPDLVFVPPEERSFDAAIVQRNFERLDDFFLSLKEVKMYWDETLDWKYPLRSAFAWMSINGFFFYVSAEHFPLLVMLFIGLALSKTYVAFLRGATHQKWIEHNPSASRMKIFRPIATLRFAPTHGSHLLPAIGDSDHPDSFVRVFYEPNYKKIPVRQIAVTECARRTQNPEWSKPQRESIREDFLRRNNNRLKDLIRHLSPYHQEAVLHDVVEPWPRKNGVVDLNAFRLSMLQPVKIDESTGDDTLVKWTESSGTIRFDIMQDVSSDSNVLIGRVRIPISSLVTDESTGGAQNEFEFTLPLAMPSRHMSQSQKTGSHVIPTISVRMQLILRNPEDRITLRDNLASEALYEALEMEVERELSWVAKYHKAKDVAKNFQQTLGVVCDTMERFKNLFLWVHPVKTLAVFVLTLLGCICFYVVPVRYLVLYGSSKSFTRKFHKAVDRDLVRFRNLLVSIPSDLDMKKMYRWRNQEYLKGKDHSEAHARLQANWSGLVLRQGFGFAHSWQERYCAVRGSRLEFWHAIADAKAGLPPKHSYYILNSLDACSKAELADVPRDGYPVVVFDVSPSLLAISPRGRRRILCLKSEDDLHKFSDAVRSSGEPLSAPDRNDPSTEIPTM